jgi:hypothetical protein
MTEFKIYNSPLKALRLIGMASIFVFIGIYMLNEPDVPGFVSWSSILFFGLGYPVGLYQLLDRRPQILINEIGVFDRRIDKSFIVVDLPFEPSKSKNRSKLSKSMGFQELNISVGSVSVDAEKLTELILLMRFAEKPNREVVVKDALSSYLKNKLNPNYAKKDHPPFDPGDLR